MAALEAGKILSRLSRNWHADNMQLLGFLLAMAYPAFLVPWAQALPHSFAARSEERITPKVMIISMVCRSYLGVIDLGLLIRLDSGPQRLMFGMTVYQIRGLET